MPPVDGLMSASLPFAVAAGAAGAGEQGVAEIALEVDLLQG